MERYTANEVARILERDPDLVRRWLREGRLQGESFGGVWMITGRELERFRKDEPEKRRRIHWISRGGFERTVFHATTYLAGRPLLTMFCGVELDRWRSRIHFLSPGIPDGACERCLAIVGRGGPDGR